MADKEAASEEKEKKQRFVVHSLGVIDTKQKRFAPFSVAEHDVVARMNADPAVADLFTWIDEIPKEA